MTLTEFFFTIPFDCCIAPVGFYSSEDCLRLHLESGYLCSTLGECNPNPELDGLPVLYKPRNFEMFCSWTAFWMPLLVFAGASLILESGQPCG